MTQPAVSVVMPVWNPRHDLFRAAVDSVLAQSLPDLELLVIEDPGETPAAPVLAEIDDPRIRHVLNTERVSMSAARNQGIGLARSDLIAAFDGDDLCEPERLERQVSFLREHPDVGVVGTSLLVIDESGALIGKRSYPTDHERIVVAMRSCNPLGHPTIVFRKKAVLAAGGYSTRPDCVCDDYDLWCRLAQRGTRFANLEEPLLRYRLHEGQTKNLRLKETLRDTLWIKKTYLSEGFTLRDRARMWGERCLLLLPSRWVMSLFVRSNLSPNR